MSILIIWMSPFLVLGDSGECFHTFIVFCTEIPLSEQCQHRFDAGSVGLEVGLHCLHESPKRVSSLKGGRDE